MSIFYPPGRFEYRTEPRFCGLGKQKKGYFCPYGLPDEYATKARLPEEHLRKHHTGFLGNYWKFNVDVNKYKGYILLHDGDFYNRWRRTFIQLRKNPSSKFVEYAKQERFIQALERGENEDPDLSYYPPAKERTYEHFTVRNIPRSIVSFWQPTESAPVTTKLSLASDGTSLLRCTKKASPRTVEEIDILDRLRRASSILPTLYVGLYKNKKEEEKLVSFHSRYACTLNDALNYQERKFTREETLSLIRHLLEAGLQIAKHGVHGNIHFETIFLNTDLRSLSISRFGTFRSFDNPHRIDILSSPDIILPPERQRKALTQQVLEETHTEKIDVWSVGIVALSLIFRLKERTISDFLQELVANRYPEGWTEKLFEQIPDLEDAPFVQPLLKGLLDLDPDQRWSFREALDYLDAQRNPEPVLPLEVESPSVENRMKAYRRRLPQLKI